MKLNRRSQVEFTLSTFQRLFRFMKLRTSGTVSRIDKYHDMGPLS